MKLLHHGALGASDVQEVVIPVTAVTPKWKVPCTGRGKIVFRVEFQVPRGMNIRTGDILCVDFDLDFDDNGYVFK